MENFIPDMYQKNIYDIDYDRLKKMGIKCLLFDLDNTIVPVKNDRPNKKLKELFLYLEKSFKIIIISNSNRKRLIPFKEELNVDVAASAKKPLKNKYVRILEIYKFKEHEVAAIGDQLLTDIWGANRMGITSILISPIGEYEKLGTKINRLLEKFIYWHLKRKNILIKGHFYE